MKLVRLLEWAQDKARFASVNDYANFCENYLDFISDGLQAVIVSKNENQYRFFQYREEGAFNTTRPINANLMLCRETFSESKRVFFDVLPHIRDAGNNPVVRQTINKFVYSCQQAIGATLDALPSGRSNTARKINGDLFERHIKFILKMTGISVRDGTVSIPVIHEEKELFRMYYQHDLILEKEGEIRAIGSVKTSSKDRIDKIFFDKFLYNKLTNKNIPHFAVFLNDVQRKGKQPDYRIDTTFLTGHFKGYTIKLTPLDGVYYCDPRPVMGEDDFLKEHIGTLDKLLIEDLWNFTR